MIDSDDHVTPDFLEKLHGLCQSGQLDLAFCNANRAYIDGRSIPILSETLGNGIFSGMEILNYFLPKKEFLHVVWWNLYRSDFIKKNNFKFIPDLKHEDIPWTTEILCSASRISYLDQPLYHYFQRPRSNNSAQRKHTATSYISIVEILANHLKQKNFSAETKEILSWQITDQGLGIYHHIEKLPWKEKIQLYNELATRNVDKIIIEHAIDKKQKEKAVLRSIKARFLRHLG